jgi:hypothetical protein
MSTVLNVWLFSGIVSMKIYREIINNFYMISRRLLLSFCVVSAVSCGNATAIDKGSICSCESQLLSMSAMNRASNIMMLLTLRDMALDDPHNDFFQYTQKLLVGEVEVAKTILLLMTVNSDSIQTKIEFNDSVIGRMVSQMLEKNLHAGNAIYEELPYVLKGKLGDEGLSLFYAVYKYMQGKKGGSGE